MYEICPECGAVDYIDYDEELDEFFCAVCGTHIDTHVFVEELDE